MTGSVAALDQLKNRVAAAQQAITVAVAAAWPKPAAGVEGLLGRQAAWQRARQLLDAGMTASAVIGETEDTETLYALREELPTWARARGAKTAKAAQIAQRVDAQMAKVAGGTSEVDLTAKFEAAALVAGLDPLLTGAEAEIAGRAAFGDGFGMNAAIASNLAMQAQRAYFQPITQSDGTVL